MKATEIKVLKRKPLAELTEAELGVLCKLDLSVNKAAEVLAVYWPEFYMTNSQLRTLSLRKRSLFKLDDRNGRLRPVKLTTKVRDLVAYFEAKYKKKNA